MAGGNNLFNAVVKNIADRQRQLHPAKEGDYIGEDGYLYCGKCRTRKEYELRIGDGEPMKVPVLCECGKEKQMQEEELEKKRKRMERVASLKKNSLMDRKFELCNFDTLTVTDDNRYQIRVCKRYAEKFGEMKSRNQGLLLYGETGTGKTHLACCIGNYLMDNLTTVFATSLVKILQNANYSRSSVEENAFIDKMNFADLLILDDLGAERSTDYALEMVYNVIDSRYRCGKPMIVTTNLTLPEMQSTTDIRYKRIYDRIFEVCYPVKITGKSWRMREAASRFDKMKTLLEDENET